MPAIDGLRGLAILLVLGCHAALIAGEPLPSGAARLVDMVFGAGWVGVDLFFLISGFLITGILLASKGSPAYYKSFFARRFLRIFPLYYLTVFLMTVVYHRQFTAAGVASILFFYYNWHVAHVGQHLFYLGPLWSLAVEEQFYIVWPTIVLLLSRQALVRLSVAGMFVALVLRLILLPQATTFQSAYYLTPCRMDALLAGALLAIWRTDATAWKRLQRLAAPTALLSFASLLGIAAWSGHFFSTATPTNMPHLRHSSIAVLGPGCTLLALLFGALIVLCTGQGRTFHFFNWQPLRRVGKYSYGIYMFHWPLLQSVGKHIISPYVHLQWNGSAVVCFVLGLAVSMLAAYISFELFEKRFLKLKRRFPAVVNA